MKPEKKKSSKNSNENYQIKKNPTEIVKKKEIITQNQKKKERTSCEESKVKMNMPPKEQIPIKISKKNKKKTIKKSLNFIMFISFSQ